jgi:hypothetical protein
MEQSPKYGRVLGSDFAGHEKTRLQLVRWCGGFLPDFRGFAHLARTATKPRARQHTMNFRKFIA